MRDECHFFLIHNRVFFGRREGFAGNAVDIYDNPLRRSHSLSCHIAFDLARQSDTCESDK